jgi:hypothetical protein
LLFELVAATIQAAACELRSEQVIVLADRNIRLNDILDLRCGDGQYAETGDLVVAFLPERSETLTVTRIGLADLVRRRVPGLEEALADEGEGSITFRRRVDTQLEAGDGEQCFAATRNIAAGELVTYDSVATTRCAAVQHPARLNYDRRHGVVRAASAVEAGEYLGRLMPLPRSGWEEDQPLILSLSIGSVTIQREVQSATPAGGGAAAFVRDKDGALFSAPMSSLARSEAHHD